MRTLPRDLPLVIRNSLAATGATRETAAPLTGQWNRVVSLALGSAVRMPPAVVGAECIVVNSDPDTTTDLVAFPAGSDSIGGGTGSIVLSGVQRSMAHCFCLQDGVWDCVLSFGTFQLLCASALSGAGALSGSAVRRLIASASLAGASAFAIATCQKWTSNPAAFAGAGALVAGACLKSTTNPAALAGAGVLFMENSYVTR